MAVMQKEFINELELRKAIQLLKPNNQLFEIRIIGSQKPISGYFKNVDVLMEKLKTVDLRSVNVYLTLNHVNEDCYARKQSDNFQKGATTTSDKDIVGYKYLFIDLDPKRTSGISSSEEEYKSAKEKANKVAKYLDSLGFEKPIKAVSGNGAHLLYAIRLANNEENQKLIAKCLKALDLLFSDETVDVDTTNFNPSRICKLYGTLAQKGANTENRPHRMSKIVSYPENLKITDKVYLEKLAKEYPEEPKPTPARHNNYNATEFNVCEWLDKYGIRYKEDSWRDGCKKLILDNCPFDHNHKAPDSMILVQSNGAIGFKCLHNSCSNKTWKDLRLMYEPDAYDRNYNDERIEEGWKRHNKERKQGEIKYKEIVEEVEDEPLFENLNMILQKKEKDNEFIKTGYNVIDKKMRGLQKGAISVVSGLRGSAKSTWLSQVALNVINTENESGEGGNVIFYSGELSDVNFAKWLCLQAAGKNHVIESKKFEGFYYAEDGVKKRIADWIGDKLWLYNNKYGNNFDKICNQLMEEIKKRKADLVIIDNLMALNLEDFDKDKYEAQTKFVQTLKKMAELGNVHIIFVAHPRKAQGFLRLDDISGTGNIANYVDNAFIIHRKNDDFKRLSKQNFQWKDDHPLYEANVTNVIEICKDRNSGNQDVFIPLYFEQETKRLKNYPAEMINYQWTDGFSSIEDKDNPFEKE